MLPCTVAEHTDADIDLLGPGVGVAERDKLKKRVALDLGKIGQPPGARVGFAQHGGRLARLSVVIHCDPVADRDGLAGQDVALRHFLVGEAVARCHLDLAAGDFRTARRADARLAGEGCRKTRGARAVEDVRLGERDAARTAVERDRHRRSRRLASAAAPSPRRALPRTVRSEALDVDALLVDVAIEKSAFRRVHHRSRTADEPGVHARWIADKGDYRLVAACPVEHSVEQVDVALFLGEEMMQRQAPDVAVLQVG